MLITSVTFRAQLQKAVVDNGGEYTGDLTKDVSHLIAFAPEGKKYAYATQWQKKVVGIKWLKDSLERGMQLDELHYHPTKSQDEQGVGAWNRASKNTQLGKRSRDNPVEPDPPRKLRRTMSARLGSQNESLWGDIVTGGGFGAQQNNPGQLRTSRSMPVIGVDNQVANAIAAEHESNDARPPRQDPTGHRTTFFSGKTFYTHGFDGKRTEALEKVIIENGGLIRVLDTRVMKETTDDEILLVPHTLSKEELYEALTPALFAHVATELWVEVCMAGKEFVPPNEYPPGGILEKYPVEDFSSHVVNCTGFTGIEVLHLSKMVTLLGGKYDQVFRPSVSVLVCKTSSPQLEKVRHAQEWHVPIVSVEWLWSCIRSCRSRPLDEYLILPEIRLPSGHLIIASKTERETSEKIAPQPRDRELQTSKKGLSSEPGPKKTAENFLRTRHGDDLLEKRRPGSDFLESGIEQNKGKSHHQNLHQQTQDSLEVRRGPGFPDVDVTLQEISNNSRTTSRQPSPAKRASMLRTFDGPGGCPEMETEENPQSSGGGVKPAPANPKASSLWDAQSINGVIQDLLNMKSRAKTADAFCNANITTDSGEKKKMFGRALSNLSNSSLGSTKARVSRASSVDSLNTDGIGSEITLDGTSQMIHSESSGRTNGNYSGRGSGFTFKGRAKPKDVQNLTAATVASSIVDSGQPDAYYGQMMGLNADAEESAPQQTQLGYEDSEEAALLREKLFEVQRREGEENEDSDRLANGSKQGMYRGRREKLSFAGRTLKDDEVLLAAAGGQGRRTRLKGR